MSDGPLVGLDWGTSSVRVYDLAGQAPVALADTAMGIKRFDGDADYPGYLEQLLGQLHVESDVPIIMSGMITSQQGWLETPYLPTPCEPQALAASVVTHRVNERVIRLMPGVRHVTGTAVDVMRGEETQIVGLSQWADGTLGPVLLPGTHSKWATVDGGILREFATFVTGELFELVSQQSVIGAVIEGREADDEAFDHGVRVGLDESQTTGGVLNSLFSVRTRGLLEPSSRTGLHSYLSGLLIGAEIGGAARRLVADSPPVVVVGDGDLVTAYRRALQLAGVAATSSPPHPAALGLKHIARLIGLP